MRLSSNPHRKDAWSNVESPEIARAWIEVSSYLKDTYSSIRNYTYGMKIMNNIDAKFSWKLHPKKALSFDIFM